jgi:integrase
MDAVISPGEGPLFGVFSAEEDLWAAWDQAQTAWLDSKRRKSGRDNTAKAYAMAVRQFFSWAKCPPWRVSPMLAHEWVRELEAGTPCDDTGQCFVGNARSKVIHRPGCRAIPLDKYQKAYPTLDAAVSDGYRLCNQCLEAKTKRSQATINAKLAALGSLYEFVQTEYVMQTSEGRIVALWPADRMNPFQAVKRVKISPYGRARFPTYDEVCKIIGAINRSCLVGKRDYALLYTIVTTCRRFSEIINLRWGDLRELPDGTFSFSYIYKGGVEKTDVLQRDCYDAICEYLVASGRNPATMKAEDAVFTALYQDRVLRMMPGLSADDNSPLTNKSANRILKKYAKRVGVDPIRAHIHGLRHAGMRQRKNEMKKNGCVDLEELMKKAAHSSLAVTQIYLENVLDDPSDPGGKAAAEAFKQKPGQQRRRRTRAVSSAQDKLPGM